MTTQTPGLKAYVHGDASEHGKSPRIVLGDKFPTAVSDICVAHGKR